MTMFYFLACNSGPVLYGNAFWYMTISGYRYRLCVLGLDLVIVCMTHQMTCLIPNFKNTCRKDNTKTTFLETFFIRYYFITARKERTAISRF